MPPPQGSTPHWEESESEDPDEKADKMFWKKTSSAAATVASKAKAKADDLLAANSIVDSDSDELSSAVNPKDPGFGTSTAIKTFYEGKDSRPGCYNWVDTPPKQLPDKVVKANTRVAIKLFKVKDNEQQTISGTTPLKFHSVEIQSPLLVAALKPIVKQMDVFIESTEPATFEAPFTPLFFSHGKIMELHARTRKDTLLKQHLDLLVQAMGQLFGGFMSQLKSLKASGLITYKLAWAYFPKGTMIFSALKDCERVCRVISTTYVGMPEPELVIDAEEIAFDGEIFAWKPVTIKVPPFKGNLPVVELPNYPLSFHEDPQGVKERLTIRAKKVIEYQELTYCEYMGVGLEPDRCGLTRHNVDGRVLIDYFGYRKHKQGLQRNGDNTNRTNQNRPRRGSISSQPDAKSGQTTYIQCIDQITQEKNKKEMLSRRDDLLYISPLLPGFALKNKEWLYFYVDDIKPVAWNDEAYGHLVYPEEHKDLVLTFVDNHQRLKAEVDDVIVGKGQGLIVLLSGPPGTGKTLTAEAVADKTRRPLYYLQAEDLGTNAAYLGSKIKKVFEMATEWDAVILLDEADVFMAKRDPGDITRNELVSIFLRELEYFRGIIFLTTNLYSTIDTAFRSRVHLHLVFSPLSVSSRFILWEKFLLHFNHPAVLEKQEIEELAKWELNGREIKNAIKTARTWCICKNFDMDFRRLEAAIKVTAPQGRKAEI